MDTKSNAEKLLRALTAGGRVTHDGYEYALDIAGNLCIVDVDGIGLQVDCSLAGFHKLADDIGSDELWLACCAMQLNK